MTDSELNKAIAEYIYPDEIIHIVRGKVLIHTIGTLDYCNNWNDLMPLVEEYSFKYEVMNRGKHFLCRMVSKDNGFVTAERADAKSRVIAECLLKVLENKNGN